MALLIVGLGNPGLQYEETRHNIAWKTFQMLSFQKDLFWKEKFKGFFAQKNIKDHQCIFLKPQTFMNLSGESVRPAMDFFKVTIEETLVVHDEIDLPFGTVHLKKGGGLAGNNGLKSIAQHLPNQNFLRLRMGVGRPRFGEVSDHVLGQFNEEEKPWLEDFTKLGASAIEMFINSGFQRAQNKFSKKSVLPKE